MSVIQDTSKKKNGFCFFLEKPTQYLWNLLNKFSKSNYWLFFFISIWGFIANFQRSYSHPLMLQIQMASSQMAQSCSMQKTRVSWHLVTSSTTSVLGTKEWKERERGNIEENLHDFGLGKDTLSCTTNKIRKPHSPKDFVNIS